MPRRSIIMRMPMGMRDELERRLISSEFSNYAELSIWLRSLGYRIGKSAVHVYGQKLQRRLSGTICARDVLTRSGYKRLPFAGGV
jgi:hypothetical protein